MDSKYLVSQPMCLPVSENKPYLGFSTGHHILTCRIMEQGYSYDQLVTMFSGRQPEILSKCGVLISKYLEDWVRLPTVAISRLSTGVSVR